MKYFLPLIICVFITGCSSSSTVEPLPTATATLSGTVSLYDHDGRPIPDKSGVHVDVENMDYHAVTDSNGNWQFDTFPIKYCTILFSKEGFGKKRSGISVNVVDTITNFSNILIQLAQEPTFTLTFDGLIAPNDSVEYGILYFHTSGVVYDSAQIYLYLIAGPNPQLTAENTNTFSSYFFARGDQSLIQGGHDRNIAAYVPDSYGIWGKSGTTRYIRAYPILGNALYIDPITNQYACSGYNHIGSNVLSAVR